MRQLVPVREIVVTSLMRMNRDEIATLLWAKGKTLFLLLDTAQTGAVALHISEHFSARLQEHAQDHRNDPISPKTAPPCRIRGTIRTARLYQGQDAVELRDVEPCLVFLGDEVAFHERMVTRGWGRAWGVYLTSSQPLAEIAKHLRSLIKVQTEDGQLMYFRFYDPRVLRVYLPTCTPEERRQFFGPVTAYWMEAEDPANCLLFCRDGPPEGEVVTRPQ